MSHTFVTFPIAKYQERNYICYETMGNGGDLDELSAQQLYATIFYKHKTRRN